MLLVFIIAGFITGSFTESSSVGRIEAYDYTSSNYGAYSHGKSDPTESSVSSSLVVNDSGFSPSDARYAISASSSSNHDSINSPTYLSGSYATPTHSTKYSSPSALQYSATYEKAYSSPYASSSATSGVYSQPKTYSTASYSPSFNSRVDSLGYSSASPGSLSGFTGSSSGLGEYASHGGSGLGLRGYATTTSGVQGASRGSSASDYTTGFLTSNGVLSGSAHSSLGGHAASSHIGSNYAGYATSGSALGAHVDPGHSYGAASAHVVPGTTISHDYSVNEGDVNYGSTNEAQRYAAPVHSSDLAYKDVGYTATNPSVYGSVKSPYVAVMGGHIGGYTSPSSPPYYLRSVDSTSNHGNAPSHYPRYEVASPSIGYTTAYKSPLSHLAGLYGGGSNPTKIIYLKDNSYASSSYPLALGGLKSKIYGLHSHASPAYVSAPSGVLSGYLSRGYGASGHTSPYLSYA